MKNLIKSSLSAIVAILLIVNSYGQTSIGLKLGGNIADTRTSGLIEILTPVQQSYPGWTAGVFVEMTLSDKFAFRPEFNFTQKGFITPISTDIELFNLDVPVGIKTKTRLNYTEIPLLIQYNHTQGNASWYAVVGPSIGYVMHGEIRPVASVLIDINLPKFDIPLSSTVDRFEVSGVIGLGGKIKVGSGYIFGDTRYQYGFTNVLKNPIIDIKLKNQGLALSAGYAYTF
jgi:Outer membrane protein beta-barrel domain